MSTSDDGASGEAALRPLPLVVAEASSQPRPRLRFGVPRIVDYMIVAAVIYFLL